MPLQGVEQITRLRLPQPTSAIVAASDKPIPVLVEDTLRERKLMRNQRPEQGEPLLLVPRILEDQLYLKRSSKLFNMSIS
jgi:hypothetical protein